jgi:hypothetical protein
MTNLSSLQDLNDELEKVMINSLEYHDRMRANREFYKRSAFYERQAGQSQDKNNTFVNLLQVFADKNIEYTSGFPKIKVPPTGIDQEQRESASTREKILYATHKKNRTPLLQKKWAFDATVLSVAIAETTFDLKDRCVKIIRHDPRKTYWQLSNDSERRVIAFWAVFMITKDEALKTYGVTPTADLIGMEARHSFSKVIDGKEWFTMAIRWDGATRVKWIGNRFVEEPHNHLMGEIPIDMAAPIEDADEQTLNPGFYLEPLIPLQAELNDVFYRRSRIVRRMSSPVVWVRGVPAGKRLEDMKAEMGKPGGGVLGLAVNGEAGLLQMQETKMLNDHEDRIIVSMTRLSGYGNAAFGESVGANTSGDALGMYFNATQRKVDHQYIDWTAFYESINAKILCLYDRFLKPDEQIKLSGFAPGSTLSSMTDDDGKTSYKMESPAYNISFTKAAIAGNYGSVVIPPSATPKNEIEMKKLAVQAVQAKFMSRTTAYDEFGILSPQDELELLKLEEQEALLNPQGAQQLMQALSAAQGAINPKPTLPAAVTPPNAG